MFAAAVDKSYHESTPHNRLTYCIMCNTVSKKFKPQLTDLPAGPLHADLHATFLCFRLKHEELFGNSPEVAISHTQTHDSTH